MAIVNRRLLHAQHRGATAATANINGVAAGGLMSASIQCGYDDIITAGADGYSFPEVDRLTQFVRGTIQCQDWVDVLDVLKGAVGSYVFYERESGLATWTKHQINDPYIHSASFNLTHRGRGNVNFGFECWASDTGIGFSDIWKRTTGQALPAKTLAYEPSVEITAGAHGATTFYHTLNLSLNINSQPTRASHDGDVGYTAVDLVWGGVPISGTLAIQDSNTMLTLLGNAEANLVFTVKQAQGAANKTLTIKNVLFTNMGSTSSAGPGYTPYTLDFVVNSDQAIPLGYDTDKPFAGDTAAITIV